MGECGESVRGLGIHWNFSVPPNPPHHDGDKVTTRDAHCGLHNEHLKNEDFTHICKCYMQVTKIYDKVKCFLKKSNRNQIGPHEKGPIFILFGFTLHLSHSILVVWEQVILDMTKL